MDTGFILTWMVCCFVVSLPFGMALVFGLPMAEAQASIDHPNEARPFLRNLNSREVRLAFAVGMLISVMCCLLYIVAYSGPLM